MYQKRLTFLFWLLLIPHILLSNGYMWVYYRTQEKNMTTFKYPYQSGYTEIKQTHYNWDSPKVNELLLSNGVTQGSRILEIWDSSNSIFQYIIVDYFGLTNYISHEGVNYIIKAAYEYHDISTHGEWHIFFRGDYVLSVDIHN